MKARTVGIIAGAMLSFASMADWQYTNNAVQGDERMKQYKRDYGDLAAYFIRHDRFPVRSRADEIGSLAFPVSLFLARQRRSR